MTQTEAFIAILVLLAVATYLSRNYLSGGAQVALGVVATAAHLI